MTPRPKFFRLAAVLLLLSAVLDIVAVDTFGSFWQDKVAVQAELQGACAQDDCFCCSATAIPYAPLALTPTLTLVSANEVVTAIDQFVPSDPLFRPPRA
jgi:hypothetical protein